LAYIRSTPHPAFQSQTKVQQFGIPDTKNGRILVENWNPGMDGVKVDPIVITIINAAPVKKS